MSSCTPGLRFLHRGTSIKHVKCDRRMCIAASSQSSEPGVQAVLAFKAQHLLSVVCRNQVRVCIEVLQSDGGDTMAAINAAALALIDAGVAMRDYVIGCTAASVVSTAPEGATLQLGSVHFGPLFLWRNSRRSWMPRSRGSEP